MLKCAKKAQEEHQQQSSVTPKNPNPYDLSSK